MNLFEDELRKAMERREPGEDFTVRVLAKVERDESRKRGLPVQSWRSVWQAGYRQLAWAAALLLIVTGLIGYRQHVRAVQGWAAKQQLLAAMHIAGAQLHQAQLRVKRIEFPEAVAQ